MLYNDLKGVLKGVGVDEMNTVTMIFLLCAVDAILTTAGLSLHLIEEGNPLMNYLIEWNVGLFFLVKLGLPMLLLLLIPLVNKNWIYHLMNVTVVLYVFINIYHLAWILPYFL